MNDDDKLLAEHERGYQAREVLAHPLVAEFFERAEQELWKAFKESPLRDAEGREKLRLMQEWLTKFRAYFEEAVTTGKMAQDMIEQNRSAWQRLKEAMRPVSSWADAE